MTLLAANPRFAAAACADGSLHIFTAAGRRALPVPLASAAAAALHASADDALPLSLLTASSSCGAGCRSACCALSCSAAGLSAAAACGCATSLLADGSPLLMLVGAYITPPTPARGSRHRRRLPRLRPLLAAAAAAPRRRPPRARRARARRRSAGCFGGGQAAALAAELSRLPQERQRLTLGHLEHNMATARALGSAAERAAALALYACALAQPGAAADARVRELCSELLGPIDAAAAADAAGAEGARPRQAEALGETVLPALATNRGLQKLIEEYAEMLRHAD